MAVPVHLHQIAYSPETQAAIEPGYLMLDNLSNERPDWYEYWPIRRFLLNQKLDEKAFYGFFSPKFGHKTQLSHADVVSFVQEAADTIDVALFSPQPDMGAFFLNVFEQAETFDPGFMRAFEGFLEACARPTEVHPLIMDARQIVFSNYFVARPAFWREWLAVNERLFTACEGPASPLQQELTKPTSYKGVQRKVFLVERVASFLLTTQSKWRTKAANPFTMGWSMSRLREYPTEAVVSDALKKAFRDHGYPEYMRAFAEMRKRFVGTAQANAA